MIIKLFNRARQFVVGMFSFYTKKDEEFAASYLNIQEMALFNQLPGFEKKHCVRVAKRMLKIVHANPDLDERKIVKLGLLHDIGKISERNTTFTKAWLVVVRYFFPKHYNKIADLGETDQKYRRYYVHKHHGRIGAQLLAKMGESSEFLSIISKHDPYVEPLGQDAPLELKILQQADTY